MKVKICGIQNPEQAINVGKMRADAIGILVGFGKDLAPNDISMEQARAVVEAAHGLPNPIDTFMLTHAVDPERNILFASDVQPSHVQLTGDVTPEGVKQIKQALPDLNIIKVISIMGPEAIQRAKEYDETGALNALLLDSRVGNMRGGTGRTHDWSISREIARSSHLPVWLAGGLRVTNLRDAMSIVDPDGVDVETGVQNPDGSKNYDLIREFIEIAHNQASGIERLK